MKKLLLILLCLPMIGFGQETGCISGDCNNGYGTKTYATGSKYIGEWKDSKWHGQGTYTYENIPNGKGSTWGGRYIGYWKYGRRNGFGTNTFTKTGKYVGEYKDDKYNGQGTRTYASGNKYAGEFKDDKYNGQGTFTWINGNKHVGKYKDNKRNGQGTFTWSSGKKYVGEFKDDKKHGQGTIAYVDGSKYVGEFRYNQWYEGAFTYVSGNKYVGEWKDHKKHGQGTFTYTNGKIMKGEWAEDQYVGEWKEDKSIIPRATKPAELIVTNIEFKDYNSNDLLEANETSNLFFTLNNMGEGAAYAINITITENSNISGLEHQKNQQVSSLASGENKQITIPITAAMNLETGKASFNIKISEGNGFDVGPIDVSFSTQALIPPNLEIVDHEFSSDVGVMRLGKIANLEFAIQNLGQGIAEDIKINMLIPHTVMPTDESSYAIEKLNSGEKKSFNFSFFTNKRFKGDKLNIIADISEKYGKYASDKTMSVKMEQDISNAIALNIASDVTIKNIKIDTFSLTSSVDQNKNIPLNPKVEKRFALVIGNEDYTSHQMGLKSEQNVDYAVNDATIFKKYCLKTLGVKAENMFHLFNATSGVMSTEIKKVIALTKLEGDTAELIIYYAGHGFPNDQHVPHLIPVDVSGGDLSRAINLQDLYQKLGNLKAKRVTVFLDACFTGGGRELGLMASRGVKVKPKEGSLSGNLVVFSASSGDQSSLPFNKEKHGIFTYHLLDALQTSKGELNYGELYDKIELEVNKTALRNQSTEQTPKVNTSQKVANDWRNWKF